MRAVVFAEAGLVRMDDVPEPELLEPTDAIVRVTRAAICGSDLHFFHLKAPVAPGDVMGHEAVGVVEAVGDGVDGFAPGDRVVVAFDIACGTCWFCRRGQSQLCEDSAILGGGTFGGDLPGAQAERVRVPWADTNLLTVPDEVPDDAAVFVGDVLTTGFYAASIAERSSRRRGGGAGHGACGAPHRAGVARARGAHRPGARSRTRSPRARRGVRCHAGEHRRTERRRPRWRGSPRAAAPTSCSMRWAIPPRSSPRSTWCAAGDGSSWWACTPARPWNCNSACTGRVRSTSGSPACVRCTPGGNGRWPRCRRAPWTRCRLISHRLPLEEAPRGYDLFDRREATKVLLAP